MQIRSSEKWNSPPSPSSIFQNKKIKYNNKKPTKNGIIWINFSKIRKARCTLTQLSLRSARLTQYMRFARCTSLSHILLRFTPQNIAYTETLDEISPCNMVLSESTDGLRLMCNHQENHIMKAETRRKGKIGIFDSGLGGLTILKEIMKVMPNRRYLYLGDNLHVPYGDKSRDEIYKLTLAGVEWLFREGAEIVILACNTASANALRKIQQEILPLRYPEKRVLGIIIPTIEEIEIFTKSGHIGVLATEATVASKIFEIEMKKKNPHIQILSRTGGNLASYIENNEEETKLIEEIRCVTSNLLSKNPLIDTLVLGCTHYALIEERIKSSVPIGMNVIGQGNIVAQKLANYLERHKEIEKKLSEQSSVHFFTTSADIHTQKMMVKFYGMHIQLKIIETLV